MAKSKSDFLIRPLRWLISAYQRLSPFGIRHCRFYPTCSEYMKQSLEEAGLALGLWRGGIRILKCHPWNPGGIDLVRTHGK
jgi:putative membrane protein insertion efficiency factor